MSVSDTTFRSEVADLRAEIANGFALVLLVASMAGLFLTLSLSVHPDTVWPFLYTQAVLVMELGVLALTVLYGWLSWFERRTLAFWLYGCGLLALAYIALLSSPGILSAICFGTACMLATLLFGAAAGWAGIAALGAGIGVKALTPGGPFADPLLIVAALFPPVLLVALTQLVARALYRNLRWMMESYESMRQQSGVLRDQSGQLAGALKSLNQTSFALARANEQLEQMVKFAEDARRAKQEFAANISHELRAPLNLIIGFSEIILYGAEHPERYAGYMPPPPWLADIHVIRRNAQHLFKLVNDILDLSQMDMNYMTIVRRPTQVGEFIRSALEELGPLIQQRGLTLDVDVEPGLPEIYADQNRILQVLLNLTNNALRFTEKGGITIRAYREDDGGRTTKDEGRTASDAGQLSSSVAAPSSVVISVADTGIGIAAGDLQRIFEPFTQAAGQSERQKQGGSGLGLTISKRFVELHGGRMWVESTPGRGSTLYFTLPVQPPLALTDTSDLSREVRRHEVGALAVVERNPVLSAMLERHLDGIAISPVGSIEELGRMVAQAPGMYPEAVLVNDLEIAGAHPANWPASLAQVPVLGCYIPAALDPVTAADRTAAFRHYLSKPFTREQFYEAIGELLPTGKGEVDPGIARILVVDDDDDTLALINRMLQLMPAGARRGAAGVVTIEARSGAQAVEFLRQLMEDEHAGADEEEVQEAARIDGVLLDIRLGDMTGFAVLAEMERHERLRNVPVCVMSGEVAVMHGGPLIAPHLTLWRRDGLSTLELTESIVALLNIALPGVNVRLSPSARLQSTAQPQTA